MRNVGGKVVVAFFSMVVLLGIQACGGSSSTATTYTVGGTVGGLSGTVVLQNNADDDLTLTADGAFMFTTALADAATYAVTVLTQPTGQTCTVSDGTGTISAANVTNVTVTCGTGYEAVMTNDTGTQSGAIGAAVQAAAASSSLFSIVSTAYAASSSTATGTLTLTDGTTVALTGTFDDPTLTLSGSGYTFTGTVDGDNISGTFTETGDADGGFAGFNSTANTVTVYCGTWTRPADPAHDCNNDRSGVWNLASSNGVVTGVSNRDDGSHVNILTGTVSGNDITVTDDGQGGSGTATISGNTVAGEFVNWKGCPGTWGGTAGCQ